MAFFGFTLGDGAAGHGSALGGLLLPRWPFWGKFPFIPMLDVQNLRHLLA